MRVLFKKYAVGLQCHLHFGRASASDSFVGLEGSCLSFVQALIANLKASLTILEQTFTPLLSASRRSFNMLLVTIMTSQP